MSSDDPNLTQAPTAAAVRDAFEIYQLGKSIYLDALARYVLDQTPETDRLYLSFVEDARVLRVLHALSVGYGWTDVIYQVSTRAEVAQAQLRGLATRHEQHGGMVLTDKGVDKLVRWTEHVAPMKDRSPRYGELWKNVTGLEG